MPEAPLEDSGSGLLPTGDGWFVVNVRDTEWWTSAAFGSGCVFEAQDRRFPQKRGRPSYWDALPWARS